LSFLHFDGRLKAGLSAHVSAQIWVRWRSTVSHRTTTNATAPALSSAPTREHPRNQSRVVLHPGVHTHMKPSEQTLGQQTVGHHQHDTRRSPRLLARMRPHQRRRPSRTHGMPPQHTQKPRSPQRPAVPGHAYFHRLPKRLNPVRCKEFQQLPFSAHMFIHVHRNESPIGSIRPQHNAVQMEVSHG
jgi:hypothetical protein